MKKTIREFKFKESGTFASYYKACEWLRNNGYSYGSMCSDEPIGILKGEYSIAKWKNLTDKERKALDGIMTSNDFREGEVNIKLTK
jgi:hypothetical protein